MSDDIDTERPPPVQSLRSKFEQLAVQKSPRSHQRNGSGNQGDLLAPSAPVSPRPRATSNTYSDVPPDTHTLRPSSSSSDLKIGTKRPPPPPPPPSRPSKVLLGSPVPALSPSPLLRPVPIPPSPRLNAASLATNGSSSTSSSSQLFGPSISSPRHKLATTPPAPHRVYSPDTQTASHHSAHKPPIPPRPGKSPESSFLQPPQTQSLEDIADSSTISSSVRNVSPFSDDEDAEVIPSAPPSLPFRRHSPHHHRGSSTRSSESSMTTSENDHSSTSRSSLPPRPPSRYRSPAPPAVFEAPLSTSPASSSPNGVPPPLPIRRSTVSPPEEGSTPPRLPSRPQVAIPAHVGIHDSPASSPTSATERKPLGSARLPPPPTRTIGLGDKLPPPRRPPSPSSDEESGDEDDSKVQMADTLPDRSRTSRRPPVLSFREGQQEPNIHVHAFSGIASVAGTTAVVAHHHHIKIYDLAMSDVPVYSLEAKDLSPKDFKVTSMEFRPSAKRADRGFVLWLGTKEGHIFELDARTGAVVASKHLAHLHAITHIFRHGRSMVTLDDSGKGLIFAPEASGEDISLPYTQPRVVRVAEKQDFVKIIGGKLWTAARTDQQVLPGALKIPVVRIYDIFTPGNVTRTVLPTEHVGAVTSATIIPSLPGLVCMGHEEGFVSIWALETEDGYPRCTEVIKISTSDVLCVEGVNDRLWAGGRSGMISAFDVSQKPWVVTNSWAAHPGLPVLKMAVDHYGIDKIGRLGVVSIGRDEQLRLWDGLLGLDWIGKSCGFLCCQILILPCIADEELWKQEQSFTTTRDLKVLLISWNCDAARPDSLAGEAANVNFLTEALRSIESPDIISFGFQEVIDLESRKMAAKNVLLGSKKKLEDGGLSEKVTGAYRRWYDRLLIALRQAMPPDEQYSVVHTESLIGLFTCVLVKNSERGHLRDASITTIKRGMGGRYGNKGGIVSRFMIDDTSICWINCHLAAGQNHIRQRNADVAAILEEKTLFPESHFPFAYVGGGDGTMVMDHEIVIVSGDMNYRIDHRRDAIVAAVRSNDLSSLYTHDQLLREIKFNRACRFRGFSEGHLAFPPTYKYDPHTDEYDTSEKRRAPAWCDRILWRSRVPGRVHQLHYRRYEVNVSDHRPISGAFTVTIKSINHEVRQQVKGVMQAAWVDEQSRLLAAAKQFYVQQALI
ncbi:putative inositol polyphosphate phosphatase, catalytic domain [Lyophyllum shimeji]|uniref:Inositol polyphosphate phosphatase, catalytic domain n=1 Tax=Lyophyllum shimeji TaxID=47721 RepID=A0A9P3UH49_LYOSH|nr:putative inositol polyphosphate phosphatase, catalytic domain [Lyophyllum shimeji]